MDEDAGTYGAAIVFIDVPPSLNFGVDYAEWRPEQRLGQGQGEDSPSTNIWVISGISPGVHFVSWSDEHIDSAGEFLHLTTREVAVYRWRSQWSRFLRVTDADEIARFQEGHDNLSLMSRAVIFPPKYRSAWNNLTFCMTRFIVKAVQTEGIRDHEAAVAGEYSQDAKFDERLLQSKDIFMWSDVPSKRPTAATDAATAIDSSKAFESMLKSYDEMLQSNRFSAFERSEVRAKAKQLGLEDSELCFLAELQMCFVAFGIVSHLQSMMHWKDLLLLVSNANSIAADRGEVGSTLIRILYSQVDQCPDDFLHSGITQSNFLIAAVESLFEVMEGVEGKLAKRLNSFKQLMERKFQMSLPEIWSLQEDGPTLVSADVLPVGANLCEDMTGFIRFDD